MWKRLQDNIVGRPAEVQIGNPTLFDTTLDQSGYNETKIFDVGQRVARLDGQIYGEPPQQPPREPQKSISQTIPPK